ncbi:hypothetical protein [Alishewanella phage vB_AspM_Slickus01]|nr:hypothetical protein [Alishewanella phage vB_AspM_Slickus01]
MSEIDTKHISELKKQIKELEHALNLPNLEIKRLNNMDYMTLLTQAYNEIIEFTIDKQDIAVLKCWSEGEWRLIEENWPDFDMNTPAQKNIIKMSGGY